LDSRVGQQLYPRRLDSHPSCPRNHRSDIQPAQRT